MSDYKDLSAIVGVVLDLVGFAPYIIGVLRGRFTPHFFSWLIWTIVMIVGSAGQIKGGGGVGSWVLVTATLTTTIVCVASWWKGERSVTRFDWSCLGMASLAILIWILTDHLLLSVIIVTCVDLIGYGPTFRKSWNNPHGELIFFWLLGCVKFLLGIVGLESYSLLTCLYPVAIIAAQLSLVVLLVARARTLREIARDHSATTSHTEDSMVAIQRNA